MTYKNIETGRSMVEMLGVLAVIGVLSIGGIMGYSYCMNKYWANQVIQDINLRTIEIFRQYDQMENINLDSYPKTTGKNWPIGLENETVGIQVDNVPEGVCKEVVRGIESSVGDIKINSEYAHVRNNLCDEKNSMVFYFDERTVTETCGEEVCEQCQKCDVSTQTCVVAGNYERRCLIDGKQQGWCISGTCQKDPDVCDTCTKNQYCYTTATPYECVDLDYTTVTIDGKIYYISKQTLKWREAMAMCSALGKNLMTVQDLLIIDSDTSSWAEDTNYQTTPLAEKLCETASLYGAYTSDIGGKYGRWIVWLTGNCHTRQIGTLANHPRQNPMTAVCK